MHAKKTAITAITANARVCALFLLCAASARLAAQIQLPPPSLADALAAPIVTVIDKTDMPAGANKHDYVSYARYYWPDPSTSGGLPFVMRDGEPNTAQIARGDYERLMTFFDTVETLVNAWRANRDDDAARRAVEWLRAWLIEPATRMNPNLDYAQIHLGVDGNRGSASGIVDGRGFGRIIANIGDLDNSRALTADDKETLRQWFNAYLEWLMTSKSGMAARAAQNSTGTWFVAQALPIADYVGRDYLARALCEEAQKRIAVQIQHDGSQPQEMQRADSLSYSAFNLAAYAQIAEAAAPLGVDLWHYVSPSRSSLGHAVDFLTPYNTDPSKWPHPQKEILQPGFLDEIIKARSAPMKIAFPKPVIAVKNHAAPDASEASDGSGGSGSSGTPNASNASNASSIFVAPSVPKSSSVPNIPNVNVSNLPTITGLPASVIIFIQKDGTIFFNSRTATERQLVSLLSQIKAASPNAPVFVNMDGDAPIKTLASVMDACRRQGFTKISIQTQ